MVLVMKSHCCKAEILYRGKLNYRCSKCDKDVTMQVVFLLDAMDKGKQKDNMDQNKGKSDEGTVKSNHEN